MTIPQNELYTRRSFGELYSLVFRIFLDRFDVFMAISALTLIPVTALLIALIGGFVGSLVQSATEESSNFLLEHPGLIAVVAALQYLVTVAATVMGSGAIVQAVSEIYVQQQPGWWACKQTAFGKVWPLLCSAILKVAATVGGMFAMFIPLLLLALAGVERGLLVFLGFLAFIAGVFAMIYIAVSWIGTIPAIMIENKGSISAIKRSFELTDGHRCLVLAALFFLGLIQMIVGSLMHSIFLNGDPTSVLFTVTGPIVNLIPSLLFFPIQAM